MTGKDFAKIVTNRANRRVQENIKRFRSEIAKTFQNLTGTGYLYKSGSKEESLANWQILLAIIENGEIDNLKNEWPAYLWRREEKKVQDELLSTMDEMQKALLASPKPQAGDCTPAE